MGFEIDEELIEVPAVTLPQPNLHYSGKVVKTPQLGHWNLQSGNRVVKFKLAGQFSRRHLLALPGSLPDSDVSFTHRALIERLKKHGLEAKTPSESVAKSTDDIVIMTKKAKVDVPDDPDNVWYIGQFFNQMCKTSLDCGVIAIPSHDTDLYAFVKRLADLNGRRVLFAQGPKFQRGGEYDRQYMSHLALKTNLKTGEENHHFDSTELNKYFGAGNRESTIVLGADIGHTGSGGRFGSPSAACVIGSVDKDLARYPGSMRVQAGGQEVSI